ncbi:MAG: asparagine synthase (glutamine-hydrolyzing) [Alphaproteobacteria bacterium]|nr:asparagine synthase (glutamine-hydrolyzing) [Alphaproteobacteria bacterium]
MCGLVAILGQAPRESCALMSLLKDMTDRIAHRGPDADGFSTLDQGRVGFGHRRLSIVNVGPDGNQPMTETTQRVHVVFNGEIYNHEALRRTLQAAGQAFRTRNSDTEVLIQGYLLWGWEELLRRLHGMFAIVLWDASERRIFAGRDRLGIKPLYYAQIESDLVFASEIKAMSGHPGFRAQMNDLACLDILNVLATPAPMTLFEGVFKLAPGEYLTAQPGGPAKKVRWWTPPETPASTSTSFDQAVDQVGARLKEAVRIRIAKEVETSVLLSGGVDSSLLLALASESGAKLRAFTAAFVGDPLNESAPAAEISARFGLGHDVIEIEEDKAMAGTLALMEAMDEPVADWACIPLDYLAGAVHSAGVKVALVGEGADELFCGYDAWGNFIRERRVWSAISAAGRLGFGASIIVAARLASRALPLERIGLVGALDVAGAVAGGQGRFRSGAESFRPLQAERLLRRGWAARTPPADPASGANFFEPLGKRFGTPAASSELSAQERFVRMRARDLGFRLPELLLMRVDKVTMAHSVEARVPFLDHLLVEETLSLPADVVLAKGGTKPIIKAVARQYLPDHIVDRPKIGLGAPMAKWLRGPFGMEVRDILASEAADPGSPFDGAAVDALLLRHRRDERDYSAYLWPIVNIALWRRKWLR